MKLKTIALGSLTLASITLWVGVAQGPADAPEEAPCPTGIGLLLVADEEGLSVRACPATGDEQVAAAAGGDLEPAPPAGPLPRRWSWSRLAGEVLQVALRVTLELVRPEHRLPAW